MENFTAVDGGAALIIISREFAVTGLRLVAAADEEQKDRAAAAFDRHHAHTVSFHGRFAIEELAPPKEEQA